MAHRLEGGLPENERESSLRYQTRCLRCYPDATGYAIKCHALGMSSMHKNCLCDAGDMPDEVVTTAYRPYELWSSPEVYEIILKAAHDGAQAMLSSPQGHLLRVVSNVMVRVDVVLGASWNSNGEISLWPIVNEMDWFNSAGMLTSFWSDSMPVSHGTDDPTSSIGALKLSPGFKVAQALLKEVLKTYHS